MSRQSLEAHDLWLTNLIYKLSVGDIRVCGGGDTFLSDTAYF